MKKNNILAILALSVFMVPVVGAMSHSGTVSDWFGVEVADTVLTDTGVQVTELSDSMKSVLEPQKRTLTGTELLPDSTGNLLPDSTANVQKSTQTEGKKYGTVKGVVSYSNGEGIVNAKLEFASETDTILTTSLADGTFSIELLEGKYDLYVSYQEDKIKPVDVKVKAGKTTEISKNKLEFDSKLLKEFEITAAKGRRRFNLHICNLAKLPLALAELEICTVPDTQKVKKVIYSDNDGNFSDSLLLGNYILRPKYLDYELDEIKVTVSNEDVNLDTIVVDNIKHLRLGETMTVKSRDALIAKYKKEIGTNFAAQNYSRVYDFWKSAFCARPDRYLVQYLDGIAILNASIATDIYDKRYDRLKLYTEELNDLFELAIINIDSLNAQIAGDDTLTVAKLRAQQIEYFRENWQIDTVLRSPVVNNDNTQYIESRKLWVTTDTVDGVGKEIKWDEELFRLQNTRLYNMTRDVVKSDDDGVEMKDVIAFAQTMFFKFRKDSARVGLEATKKAFYADTTLTYAKARRVLEAVSPNDSVGQGSQKQPKKPYFAGQMRDGITDRFAVVVGWSLDRGNLDAVVEYYRKRWANEGDKDVVPIILADRTIMAEREHLGAMELYYEALKNMNESEPSYDLLSNIITRAKRLKKNDDVITYSQKLFVEPEFFEESGYEQARKYIDVYVAYTNKKGSIRQRYPYVEKAIQACPEFSDAYCYKADLAFGASKKMGLSFCVAYDLYAEAKQKRMALSDDSEIKTANSAEEIQNKMNQCVKYFPEYNDEHLKGTFFSGDKVSTIAGYKVHAGVQREITILGIGTFRPVVRAIEREAAE